MNMTKVIDLKCNYLMNPIGIDTKSPQISWKIESEKYNFKQGQFQVQVALDKDFDTVIWSHRSYSDESINISYGGPSLESRQRYYYRVKVWDISGEESAWSEQTSYWEMGFLKREDWQAKWITPAMKEFDEDFHLNKPFTARKKFNLEGEVLQARLYVTSLGLYEVNINGMRVGEDYLTPGWTDYSSRLQYQTYDVTELLRKENNEIKMDVGPGWFAGFLGWNKQKNLYGNITAGYLQLEITFSEQAKKIIISDQTWEQVDSPILMSDIYNGEKYDARIEPKYLGQMKEISFPTSNLIAQEGNPVRKMDTVKPINLFRDNNGDLILDMGQNMVGWLKFKIRGKVGAEVSLIHGEVLDKDGNFYRENIRKAQQKITLILGKEEEVFEPHFTFQGFRYVKLQGFSEEETRKDDFLGMVLYSGMEQTISFETSDKRINKLQQNIIWGQRGNFVDVPTDCPQRDERLGWTGDAQIFAPTACFNMGSANFFKKWLKDLKANQGSDGSVPFVVPDILKGAFFEGLATTTAGWGDAAVICPWVVYQNYRDTEVLKTQYTSMKKWVDYIRNQGDDEYIWDTGLQLGDWLALDNEEGSFFGATDGKLIATAFFAYSAYIFSQAAKVLGNYDDYKNYRELSEKIREKYQEVFFNEEGHLISDTQTAQIISLRFKLVSDKNKKKVVDRLVKLIRDKEEHLDTGFIGTPYICHVLSDNGHEELAYKLLFNNNLPSWLYQVEQGATTMWEHWDSIKTNGSFWNDKMNSFNHYAYGSIGEWMYQNIGGIRLREAGYKKFIIAPKVSHQLNYAKMSLETMYGTIKSKWSIHKGTMNIEVQVPPNTECLLVLPKVNDKEILKNKVMSDYEHVSVLDSIPNRNNEGLADVISYNNKPMGVVYKGNKLDEQGYRIADNELGITLGSGKYEFSYTLDN